MRLKVEFLILFYPQPNEKFLKVGNGDLQTLRTFLHTCTYTIYHIEQGTTILDNARGFLTFSQKLYLNYRYYFGTGSQSCFCFGMQFGMRYAILR